MSAMKMDFICRDAAAAAKTPAEPCEGVSDHEDSEDEQLEHAAWQDVDLNPAVELVAKLVRESLDAGKTYNKSITAKTSQLLTGCDGLLLELKGLAETRAEARQRAGPRAGQGGAGCSCGQAMAMLPLRNPVEPVASSADAAADKKQAPVKVDDATEDQTDRALAKMEAAMVRLREMAEIIQATSMQGEANLVSKVSLQSGTFQALEAAVQASAAAATATAIAQERGRSSSAFGRLYLPLQVQKLQEWYYSYPRPLLDELTLMRTILNYRPYANPFQVGGLSLAHVRDWFKRRRFRERMRYVKLAVEAGHDSQAAEEEIDLRLEQRIAHLRASVDPNELVKEVDRVRAQSYLFDAAVNAFTRPNNIRSFISSSYSVPTAADQQGGYANGRGKRQRTQDSDLDDISMVKHATVLEVMALQNRLRSLMEQPKTTVVTNGLQQVIDLLRAMKVEPDVRIQTGLVADLKQILKAYTKPTLLRKATIALMETLGMTRRSAIEQDVDDDAPLSAPASPALSTASSSRGRAKGKASLGALESGSAVLDDESLLLPGEPPLKKTKPVARPAKPRTKEKKGRVLRPMKFSMDQLTALEAWFQQKYKPSQEEMENYLMQLNTPPLRDMKKQTVDVNMTQLRRWFNKRRCLRRPPFALMTQQEAAKEGSKNAAVLLKAASTPASSNNGVLPEESVLREEDVEDIVPEVGGHHSYDDTNDDSSDEDGDDDSSDGDDDDDGDDDSSDDGELLIDQALA